MTDVGAGARLVVEGVWDVEGERCLHVALWKLDQLLGYRLHPELLANVLDGARRYAEAASMAEIEAALTSSRHAAPREIAILELGRRA